MECKNLDYICWNLTQLALQSLAKGSMLEPLAILKKRLIREQYIVKNYHLQHCMDLELNKKEDTYENSIT